MGCACLRCHHRDAPFSSPFFLSLRLRHLGSARFLPQLFCRLRVYLHFTCCSGSKNVKDGCGVNEERSFRTLTSLQVLFVGLNRRGMDRVKWLCRWKSGTAARLSVCWPGAVGERWWCCHSPLPRTRAQPTWWKGDKRQEFFDWAAHTMKRAEPIYLGLGQKRV